jgi:CheY-like chemotaxis protein
MPHQTASYFAAGIDECVAKPIEVTALFAALETALAGDVAAEAKATASG